MNITSFSPEPRSDDMHFTNSLIQPSALIKVYPIPTTGQDHLRYQGNG